MANLLEKVVHFFSNNENKKIKTSRTSVPPEEQNVAGDIPVFSQNYSIFDLGSTNFNVDLSTIVSTANNLIETWREISTYPYVSDCVEEITNSVISGDVSKDIVKIDLNELEVPNSIRDEIEFSYKKVYNLLNFDEIGEDLFKLYFTDGVLNFEVIYDEDDLEKGIIDLILLTPINFYGIKDETGRRKFYYLKPGFNPKYDLSDLRNSERVFSEEQIVRITSGLYNKDRTVVLSYLTNVIKPLNQLALIEDSLVIFRAVNSTEKRIFNIDVGGMPPQKAEEYIQRLSRDYKQKDQYDFTTGKMQNRPRSISVLENIYLPKMSEGRGHSIEILQGNQPDFEKLADLNYFIQKIYKSLHVPWSRFNPESTLTIQNQLSVTQEEIRFYKFVNKLQRKFSNLFLQLLKRDLISRKIMREKDWEKIKYDIHFNYNQTNPIAKIKFLQMEASKFELVSNALELVENKIISKTYLQKNILEFDDDQIMEIKKQIEKEEASGEDELAENPAGIPEPDYSNENGIRPQSNETGGNGGEENEFTFNPEEMGNEEKEEVQKELEPAVFEPEEIKSNIKNTLHDIFYKNQ